MVGVVENATLNGERDIEISTPTPKNLPYA
jgi:hypothetical protein